MCEWVKVVVLGGRDNLSSGRSLLYAKVQKFRRLGASAADPSALEMEPSLIRSEIEYMIDV